MTAPTGRAPAHRHPTRCLVETVYQRARRSGVSELTVRRRIRRGQLRAVQIGGTWRLPADSVSELYALPEACSVRQVANSLNVAELTVRRWIAAGDLPASKVGRRWVVERRFLEELLVGTPQASERSA